MGKFSLGEVLTTRGIAKAFTPSEIRELLARHEAGDWGDVLLQDVEQNEWALENGHRILSSYAIGKRKVWIVTEADRSATTVLFPEEY